MPISRRPVESKRRATRLWKDLDDILPKPPPFLFVPRWFRRCYTLTTLTLSYTVSNLVDIFYWKFPIFRKKMSSRGGLGQHLLGKFSSASWIRRGVTSCSPYTSFDETNDSVVKSERGELVRGYDPPWCTALTLRPVICGGRRSGL